MFFMLQVYVRSSNKHVLRILTARSKRGHQNSIYSAYVNVRKSNWD